MTLFEFSDYYETKRAGNAVKRVLIANRGEIVNRVIHTAQKLGLETAVVFSDADKNAPYIRAATASAYIGPSAPPKSYLNIEALMRAIAQTDADAVHPGYGFLSESAPFSEAVTNAGAVWIGPSTKVMEKIESKSYCRKMAAAAGVPIAPGSEGVLSTPKEILQIMGDIGTPILLKLDKGGGGKGIETIEADMDETEIIKIYESMSRIGTMAFSCGDIYVEKKMESPRHIEVQFLADKHGNIVCLGERECSVQRRYQKIIEESPSTVVSEEERKALYSHTRRFVHEIGYTGAGTVEYLRDVKGNFSFMEINARLQVEHPVSEMVTGIDIVEWQIRIANGEALPFGQDDIHLSGHAIESRLYAEDPITHDPSPGTISRLVLPGGTDSDVRIEHALYEGCPVSPYYDPMLCKIIVRCTDRVSCIEKMKTVLCGIITEGISTNIDTNMKILKDADFLAGTFSTDFIEKLNRKQPETAHEAPKREVTF
jgi:acetyl/propionyl-CoA carboxylase alpha subunit